MSETPQKARLIAKWRATADDCRKMHLYPQAKLLDQCADELAALDQPHQCEWKDAIIDACVVDWILTAEHESDPRKAINDLLGWQYKLALDPAVSEEAAKLHARIAELEAALDQTAPPTLEHLASAMKKLLPPELLTQVLAYLDPLTPFIAALNEPSAALDQTAPQEPPAQPGRKDWNICECCGQRKPSHLQRALYDPTGDTDRPCVCGHPYYRHFDSYDDQNPIGCKYCECRVFQEPEPRQRVVTKVVTPDPGPSDPETS